MPDTVERKAFDRFAKAVAAFLATRGWNILVVGGVRLEARPPFKYNYRLVLDITGAKKQKGAEKRR